MQQQWGDPLEAPPLVVPGADAAGKVVSPALEGEPALVHMPLTLPAAV